MRKMGSVGTIFRTHCSLEQTTFRFYIRRLPMLPNSPPILPNPPLTLWACHSVAFMICAKVAPSVREMSAMILEPLLSAREALVCFVTVLGAFFATLPFFGAETLALAALAGFLAVGAPFVLAVAFFALAFRSEERRVGKE